MSHLVIVGGSDAAINAARPARELDTSVEVTVILGLHNAARPARELDTSVEVTVILGLHNEAHFIRVRNFLPARCALRGQ